MKKLLLLAVVAVSLSTAGGCSWWNNMFHRGQPCNSCGPTGAYTAAPVVTEPGVTYAPGPMAN